MGKAPDAVLRLVENFDRHIESYHSSAYNEAQLRQDFLNPFFEALGWDVANRKGYDQRYREVVHEDAIKVGGTTKAPDYCFQIGGVRRFFVEAKAPFRDIANDPAPALQVRRYAWTAKLPLSLLSDFEELSVYDTRLRPGERDKPGTARLRLLTHHEYESTWEELVGTFSPDAILRGSFDKYAEKGGRRGTTQVDDEFLKDIERWRDLLARNIALRNPRLGSPELNAAVQRTIDRIIFLRICEDRGIEPAGSLQALTGGPRIYPRLFELFQRADQRYNSGLFHFSSERGREEPDELAARLQIDDAALKTVISQLYYPSPYEFSVFPADILGQVYEQFLGKVIRLTEGHHAKVEEKPEVRKAGGVYYTPTYIVDYIVKNTVGALIWGYSAGPDGTCPRCGAKPGCGGKQGTGSGEWGLGTKGGGFVGADSELQGPQGLAGSDDAGRADIPAGATPAGKRKKRAGAADEPGSGLYTCEHCGRTWLQPPPGLSQPPVHQQGFADGTGNVPDSDGAASTPERRAGETRPGAVGNRDPNAARADSRSSSAPTPTPKALTPAGVSRLRILDPACGSGSFLLGAYQYLLDWHGAWYAKDGPDKHRKELYKGPGGEWRLTTQEKKRILLDNIYGVDIDAQAVEVTKLSLLLKVLEGESEQTIDRQMKMYAERALPDLSNNIKCGNSLIGSDFWQGQQQGMFDDEAERLRINAFDWDREFPEVFRHCEPKAKQSSAASGGFDAVIGNPPYIRVQALNEWAPESVEFYKQHYVAASKGNYDIYVVFVEKGLSLLNKTGLLGFILPHKFFNSQYGEPLRGLIADGKHLSRVVHFGHQQVFEGATTYTCLMFLSASSTTGLRYAQVADLQAWRSDGTSTEGVLPTRVVRPSEWNFSVGRAADLTGRLENVRTTLADVTSRIFQGLVTGADKVYTVPFHTEIESALARPLLLTGSLVAYAEARPSARLIFPYAVSEGGASLLASDTLKRQYPQGWAHLCEHRDRLTGRERGKWHNAEWYAYARSQNLSQMGEPKLIIQVTALRPTVLMDDRGLLMTGGGSGPFYGVRPRSTAQPMEFLLGILNSRLFGWVVRQQSTPLRGGYVKFSKQYIESAPVPNPVALPSGDVAKMVEMVEQMLDLHKKLSKATGAAKTTIERQIAATDKSIDAMMVTGSRFLVDGCQGKVVG